MTELVTINYIAERLGLCRAYSYTYIKKRGIKPTKSLGTYYYHKDQVDHMLEGYVCKARKPNDKRQSTFTFTAAQMEIIKFCRGDYAAQGSI